MSDDFIDSLIARALDRIVDRSATQVAILGNTPATLHVRAALCAAGLEDRIVGIFDRVAQPGAGIRGLPELADTDHDLLVVGRDAEKADLLIAYRDQVGGARPTVGVVVAGTAHLDFADPLFTELEAPALVPSYATGSTHTRVHLFQCLRAAAANGLSGAIVEFGAFKGGTTAWLARVAHRLGLRTSPVIGFDSWAGFPPRRSVLDMYEHPRCVFTDFEAVRAYVEPFGVELVEGDITDTYRHLQGRPLLLCFFDTDNYSPAHAALELCAGQLVVGGSIVFDHVATLPSYIDTLGERIAAYEVLRPAGFLHLHGTGVFTKIAG